MVRKFDRDGYRSRALGVRGSRGSHGGRGGPQVSRRQVRGIIVVTLIAIVVLALSAQFLGKTVEFAKQPTQFAKAQVLSKRYETMEDGQEQCRLELQVHVHRTLDVRAHVYVAAQDANKFTVGRTINVTYRQSKTGPGIEIRRITVSTKDE